VGIGFAKACSRVSLAAPAETDAYAAFERIREVPCHSRSKKAWLSHPPPAVQANGRLFTAYSCEVRQGLEIWVESLLLCGGQRHIVNLNLSSPDTLYENR
jgi:hypothetical protein